MSTGKIAQVIGPVVDVVFPTDARLPEINNALVVYKDGEQAADFISCVAFRKLGEFAEKYLRQGTKIAITGRIQTGSYTNRDGQKVYTTDVIIESQEFVESKKAVEEREAAEYGGQQVVPDGDGFMNIPDGIDDELPFN